jgi:hypothetical protein
MLVSCHPAYPLFLSHNFLFPSIFIMAAIPQANMAAPTILCSVGNLAKEDDQMIIILCSVQFRNAHIMLGRSNKGVSCIICFFVILLLIVVFNNY